jgi:hypothetical protein
MRVDWIRASLVVGVLAIAPASACSSSSSAPATADAGVTCPASLAAALNASCGSAPQTCTFLYACNSFSATATCTCQGGRFACNDVADAAIQDEDSAPTCPASANSESCPAFESSANQSGCTELGLVCAYPSACPGNPDYDTCQCIPDPTGSGATPHFDCQASCTLFPDASLPEEAGPSDAPSDAPPDAVRDAPADTATDAVTADTFND